MLWQFRQELIKMGYRPVKVGGHKHSVSGNIVILVSHVISEDHVIKG